MYRPFGFKKRSVKTDSLMLFMVLAAILYLAYLLVKIKYINKYRLVRFDGYFAFIIYAVVIATLVSIEAFIQ